MLWVFLCLKVKMRKKIQVTVNPPLSHPAYLLKGTFEVWLNREKEGWG